MRRYCGCRALPSRKSRWQPAKESIFQVLPNTTLRNRRLILALLALFATVAGAHFTGVRADTGNTLAPTPSPPAKVAYLWRVIQKMSQHLPDLRVSRGGTVVLRFVIARDGRLMDVSVVQSSGVAALDRGMQEALKAGSPYPPMPATIPGSEVTFTQRFVAKARAKDGP